jgi:clan AA aspartic protease
MLYGRVENRHALLEVMFVFPGGNLAVEFVVDTGFTDALCLPQPAVDAMQLPFQFDFPATLADGSVVMLPVYEARILWDDEERRVHILATGNRPLIGTALLDGYELTIPFQEGAQVSLEPL